MYPWTFITTWAMSISMSIFKLLNLIILWYLEFEWHLQVWRSDVYIQSWRHPCHRWSWILNWLWLEMNIYIYMNFKIYFHLFIILPFQIYINNIIFIGLDIFLILMTCIILITFALTQLTGQPRSQLYDIYIHCMLYLHDNLMHCLN